MAKSPIARRESLDENPNLEVFEVGGFSNLGARPSIRRATAWKGLCQGEVYGGAIANPPLRHREADCYRETFGEFTFFEAARFAVVAVVFAATFAFRPVAVVARLAVDAVSATDFFALAAVALAPEAAVRAVVIAPDLTLRTVWPAPSVAAEAAPRTLFARVRASVEPVGDTFGFLV